ncbi:MAG: hypothetical protein P1U57_02450 [Oleibacter sp.]|nr:hypothetical protein [Thalassolituus sp.]
MLLRYGSLLFAAPAILLLSLYGIELSAVSECTTQGLSYSYQSGECSSQLIEQMSYYRRHSGLVNSMMLLSMLGSFMMIFGMLKKGMTRPPEER